jgi:hypothetical protein
MIPLLVPLIPFVVLSIDADVLSFPISVSDIKRCLHCISFTIIDRLENSGYIP